MASAKRSKRQRGLSIEAVLNGVRAMNLKPGQSVTIEGLTFTKTKASAGSTGGNSVKKGGRGESLEPERSG